MFMPIDFILRLLSSLLSIGILGGGAYVLYQWREGVGKSDIATRPFASDRMSREIPQAALKVLAPGGHMALLEKNAEFADMVQRFSNSCLQPIA